MSDELEEYMSKRLKEAEGWAHTTICSGGLFQDEDVRSPNYLLQCKRDETRPNIIIKYKDWKQLQAAALRERTPEGNYRMGAFVSKNEDGTIVVTLDHEDFLGMVEILNQQKDSITELTNRLQEKTDRLRDIEWRNHIRDERDSWDTP